MSRLQGPLEQRREYLLQPCEVIKLGKKKNKERNGARRTNNMRLR